MVWQVNELMKNYKIEWEEEDFDGERKLIKGVCFSGVNWESKLLRYTPNVRNSIPDFSKFIDRWADALMSFPWVAASCYMEGRTFVVDAQAPRNRVCTILSLARCLDERPGHIIEFFYLIERGAIPERALAACCFLERNCEQVYVVTTAPGHSPIRSPESRAAIDKFVEEGPKKRTEGFESLYLWDDGNTFLEVDELEEWALTGKWTAKLRKVLKFKRFEGLAIVEEIPNRVSRIIVDGKVYLADKSIDGNATLNDIRRLVNA